MTVLEAAPHAPTALTAPGKPWAVKDDLRTRLCLTDDGVLHIVDGYAADPFVLAFIGKLKRSGLLYTTCYVTPEQLNGLYQGVAASSGSGRTYQQLSREASTGKHETVVEILRNATQLGASDVHFFATPNGHQLRYRIHGELETIKLFSGNDGEQLLSAIYGSMSESTDTNYRPNQAQDGRLRSEFVAECGLFGARIATRPTLNGPWMALRLLYDSDNSKVASLDEMGYLPVQIEALTRLIHRTDGMVFLTGTTGSGKSTTIQTALKMLIDAMAGSINVVTVEDPVEYRIPGANQTPLQGGEWVDAITNLMRLDPDVLLIGETRDTASALAAFQAALTGHGLWSTLHVNSAAASLQRLHDLGVEDNLLLDPGLMKGLLNQSLTRVLCPHCRTPYLPRRNEVTADLRTRIETHCIPEQVFLKGEGCQHCKGRGIIRRTAIAEIILPDLAFMLKFKTGKAQAQSFWVKEQGGTTKNMHLIQRINEGLVDPSHGERDVCPLDEDAMTVGGCP